MRTYFITLALALTSLAASSQSSLKVATFNIRNSNANDGINRWENRKAIAAEFINTEKPDIIGMQEVLQEQLDYLSSNLNAYSYVGVAREDGKQKGEYAPLFFRKDRFSEKNHQTIWLSETPSVAGSVGWDAALTRIATIVTLYDKKAKREVTVINTHFDHMGVKAREESIKLIRQKVKELDAKSYIVMGDFNSRPTESAYLTAVKDLAGFPPLIDARASAKNRDGASDDGVTFHDYGKITKSCIIDYIFTGKSFEAKDYQVMAIKKGDVYISDHYPVVATLQYKK
ncbi:endonuclease/exonuclease/phosphatase family protein [uncultured Acetobacteroides sp.]|uniref:endonuclease/exonuclease/phosphatase family protein n=1 Tax=uncultured Acetobacteroides sp. TaxID=1760811 RepID=UPI0029F4B26B|nr:endonuclease/exonuclease/phosphatase family protein [uncultured Acetobacteroides sp.]